MPIRHLWAAIATGPESSGAAVLATECWCIAEPQAHGTSFRVATNRKAGKHIGTDKGVPGDSGGADWDRSLHGRIDPRDPVKRNDFMNGANNGQGAGAIS
jgi:hypothetical protein